MTKKKTGTKKKPAAAGTGRRGKYEKWLTESGIELLSAWARDGLIDEQIAQKMGVASSTYYEWKRRYPALAEAVSKGKEVVDIKVENALLKRALGYTCTEVRKEGTVNGIKNGTAKVVITEKPVPPDVTAQIFWLKNRKPDTWREKLETYITADGEVEDALSKSLREMAETLKSDAVQGTS